MTSPSQKRKRKGRKRKGYKKNLAETSKIIPSFQSNCLGPITVIKSRTAWIQIQTPPLPSGVTLGKSLNFMPQFLLYKMRVLIIPIHWVLVRITDIILVKLLEISQAYGKCMVNVSK